MSAGRRLVVIGDSLLDRDVDGTVERLCPDAPAPVLDEASTVDRPGGAGLAALLAAGRGYEVALVTALADDAGGARLSQLLTASGVAVYPMRLPGATPEKIRLRADRRVLLRLDRGGDARKPEEPGDEVLGLLRTAAAVLVSDYGRGVARLPGLRAALTEAPGPVVWDPHPRGPAAVPGARLVTPNESEVGELTGTGREPSRIAVVARGAQELRRRWGAGAVAVTLGADGALLCHAGSTPLVVPVPVPAEGDTCGAGDRFASAAALALADGALVSEAVQVAVGEAAAYVSAGGPGAVPVGSPGAGDPPTAAGPAAAPRQAVAPTLNGRRGIGLPQINGHHRAVEVTAPPADPRIGAAPADPCIGAGPADPRIGARAAGALVAQVRARGGTVVASGGCFDLLHAGHVATLEAARALGDCLVVCVNSDASVAALKGPDRPLVPQHDRVRLLSALGCVDAVVVFDELTPHSVLSWLRPHLWVKGGDYSGGAQDGRDLPEADVVRRWGGQAVVVPYLAGRSTTRMIDAARERFGLGEPGGGRASPSSHPATRDPKGA
jgi:rfaE bifunctional protein nucleotidyltransferase chain/domain/rfaE bifunctional protein kinase chain/domain